MGYIDDDGIWQGFLVYDDSKGAQTTQSKTYTGNLQVGRASVYFQWQVNQGASFEFDLVSNPTNTITSHEENASDDTVGDTYTITSTVSEPNIEGGAPPYTHAYQWEESTDGATYTPLASAAPYNTNTLHLNSTNTTKGNFYRCKVTTTDSESVGARTLDTYSDPINSFEVKANLSEVQSKVGDIISVALEFDGNKVGYQATSYQWFRSFVTNLLDRDWETN